MPGKFSNLVERVFSYRALSLTWPASMQIYWNKRKRWKEFHSHRIGLGHQHGRRFIVWDTNMAAVTSCENNLFQCTLPNVNTLKQPFFCLFWRLCEADLQAPAKCMRERYFGISGMPSNRAPRETTGDSKKLSNIFFTSIFLSFLQKNGKNWTQFHFVTEHETTLMGSLHLVKQAPLWSLLSPISMGSWVVIPCTPRLIGAAITPV